ncbi:MAG TPA: RsmD family RNA methyltransferase [Tepidisphaeraceae bacterium]
MRIISGQFRSRVILPPEDNGTTRPITDRAKQSLFDIITPLLDGAVVYDCFAGTGSMGLESLSRGARRAVFFEADRSALQRLRKNIASLDVAERSTVVSGDLFKYFRSAPPSDDQAALVFLDLFYRFLREQFDQLRRLVLDLSSHLSDDATVLFRHDAGDHLELPPFREVDGRTYGDMKIDFLLPHDPSSISDTH